MLITDESLKAVEEKQRQFNTMLESEIENIARGNVVTPADVERAFRLVTNQAKKDAQADISVALRENRLIEWTGYAMAVILFLLGIFLLIAGIYQDNDAGVKIATIVGGTFVDLFFIIPLRLAINSRRENIQVRLLGVLLDRVNDPKVLAQLLRQLFKELSQSKSPGSPKRSA
jgi:mRNA-degrading endonuclease HigB of HigAB toxin-antitoxin module